MKKIKPAKCTSFAMFGILLFFVYTRWYAESFGENNLITHGIVVFTTFFVFIDIVASGWKISYRKKGSSFLFMCVVFLGYSFITGVFVAVNQDTFFSKLESFLLELIICGDVWYVSEKEGSYEWLLKVFVVTALLCALGISIYGYSQERSRIALSEENNTNQLGMTFVVGIAGLIYKKNNDDKWFLVRFGLILILLYATALTGSRKSFISACVIFVFWAVVSLVYFIRQKKTLRNWISISVLVIGFILAGVYAAIILSNTAVWSRLPALWAEVTTGKRHQLYIEAFEFWKKSPIIGIGYNQYASWSSYGDYSHSSYAEILSCTGIVGFLLFYIPVIRRYYVIGKNSIRGVNTDRVYQYRMLFTVFTIEMFLEFGVICIYSTLHMVLLMFLFGQSGIMMDSIEPQTANVMQENYPVPNGC